jgi:hypothetical protein
MALSRPGSDLMPMFIDEDTEYLAWVERHPEGFVVNADQKPKAEELVPHKASCFSIRIRRNR